MTSTAPDLNQTLRPGIYRHYKGPLYHVMDFVTHTESDERFVLYRCLYGEYDLWVRPVATFFDTVNVNGTVTPRFQFSHDAEPEGKYGASQ